MYSRIWIVSTRTQESGLKLNKQKCKFGASQFSHLGHIISSEDLKPDSRIVQAILDMPPPQNKSDMQRFLGAINYLGKFIPISSILTKPFRKLLNKDVAWKFSYEQIKVFDTLKKMVTETPVLQFFDHLALIPLKMVLEPY